ncbi:hypothetical protein [Allocoleopsis sp.]|uniref:hypothetical protein n=1 Tax=Allocoleopsis sp. TaxID=3088169 RepID=UPI002FD519E6
MASEQQVKRYLAYWFQLGKKVLIHNGDSAVLPQSVIAGDRYSEEFEKIWQLILSPESGDCYLEATNERIAELLTPKWLIEPCVRCDMPVPMINIGLPPELCPCNDLPTWPNTEIPAPREPISNQTQLREIRDRLNQAKGKGKAQEDLSASRDTELPIPHNTINSHGRLNEIWLRLNEAKKI